MKTAKLGSDVGLKAVTAAKEIRASARNCL